MNKYNFSIIIPHKDIPDLLERCILTIPKRNDTQIIVVDDNSCIHKVNPTRLKSLNNNILYIETKEGKGAGYARNVALNHIDGKWVMFADADDYFSNNLNRFLDEYLNAKEDIIYLINKTVDGKSFNELNCDLKVSEALQHCNIETNDFDYLRYRSHAPWTQMIKSSLIKSHSIKFQEVIASNDVWFSVQCGYYADKVSVCPYPIYIRVVRQGSLQYSLNKDKLLSRIKVGYKVNNFLKSIGKIEYYNETWGYFLDLRKISKWLFIKEIIPYILKTPNFIIVRHLIYILKKYMCNFFHKNSKN